MRAASVLAGLLMAAMLAPPVWARKGEDDFRRGSRSFEQAAPERRAPSGGMEIRGRGDERNAVPDGNAQRRRLSPEERFELRRDIRDAGRDLYSPGRRSRN